MSSDLACHISKEQRIICSVRIGAVTSLCCTSARDTARDTITNSCMSFKRVMFGECYGIVRRVARRFGYHRRKGLGLVGYVRTPLPAPTRSDTNGYNALKARKIFIVYRPYRIVTGRFSAQ